MDNAGVLLFCVGLPILIVVVAAIVSEQNKKAIRAARQDYYNALEFLKEHPENNDAREAALLYGRVFIAKAGKSSTFTEVSLMNDLNAVQQQYQASLVAEQRNSGDVKARLQNLEALYNDRVITKEEYETRRQAILSEI